MARHTGRFDSRGVTLVELVVVIAVLGVLISLLLVGVQRAREATRRTSCHSNLRQIAMAMSQYEAAHRMFPPGNSNGYSPHVFILPYLELDALYAQIDVQLIRSQHARRRRDVHSLSLPIYRCPSDGAPHQLNWSTDRPAGTNYAGNAGGFYHRTPFNGMFRYWTSDGFLNGGSPIRVADVTDGLSATALVAELLRADGSFARMRTTWNTPFGFGPSELEAFRALCRGLPANPHASGWSGPPIHLGTPWTHGNVAMTLYNHVLTPNHPSCLNETELVSSATTAASFHSGGVNLACADGHVSFVVNGIDVAVWEGLGSRDGGERSP